MTDSTAATPSMPWPDQASADGASADGASADGACAQDTRYRTAASDVRELVVSLDGIEDRPLAEHADRYADVHTQLQAALTSLDDAVG